MLKGCLFLVDVDVDVDLCPLKAPTPSFQRRSKQPWSHASYPRRSRISVVSVEHKLASVLKGS